jgi:hypothetical protein
MKVLLPALALVLSLGACAGNPQRLPVGLSICNAVATASGFSVSATVQNKSDKPITSLGLALDFYRDFRYAQFTASTHLRKELDPGEKRDVTFDVAAPAVKENGAPMRCLVTHVGYMDGTSADLPPSQ